MLTRAIWAAAIIAVMVSAETLTIQSFDATATGGPWAATDSPAAPATVTPVCAKKGGCVLVFTGVTGSDSLTFKATGQLFVATMQSVTTYNVQYDKTLQSFDDKLTVDVTATLVRGASQFIFTIKLQFEDDWDRFVKTTPFIPLTSDVTKYTITFPASTTGPINFYCQGPIQCAAVAALTPLATAAAPQPIAGAGPFTTGDIWIKLVTGAKGHKFAAAEAPAVFVTPAGATSPSVIPVSLASYFPGLTGSSIAPGVISANGEVGKTVATATPNATIEVNSVRNRAVADDEYKNNASGIVFAAVGAAAAFVLCLGAIAAAAGGKAATKAVQ